MKCPKTFFSYFVHVGSHKRHHCVKSRHSLWKKRKKLSSLSTGLCAFVIVATGRLGRQRDRRRRRGRLSVKHKSPGGVQVPQVVAPFLLSGIMHPSGVQHYVDVTVNIEHSNMGADQQQPMLATDKNYQMIE